MVNEINSKKVEFSEWNHPSTNTNPQSESHTFSTTNLNLDRDHNSNLSSGPEKVCGNQKSLNMDRFSALTHEQLLSELMKAHARIDELESTPKQVAQCPIPKSGDDAPFTFAGNSSDDNNCLSAMHELPMKTDLTTPIYRPRHNYSSCVKDHHHHKRDDFVVAYQHKGLFPSCDCDEDLTFPPDPVEQVGNESDVPPEVIFENGIWENDLISMRQCEGQSEVEDEEEEDFPLIQSPVLDTPPYEYIFLTRENEAKCRIFLNPKLNKVFQEELLKLQKQGEHEWSADEEGLHNHYHHKDPNKNTAPNPDTVDWHNQNHLVNCSSSTLNEVKAVLSASNEIHCFDPSDVDLELKKIFMDKPPITHRIVRRKSRKDRGSSVPAVDSYYGTCDLTKVGHASYFIPTLTESERKAIGWKPDYHFGHWVYTAMNIPNIRTNPIPLHPHPHLDDEYSTSHSKHSHPHSHHHHHHHHHHPQDVLLMQNPIHQKEIIFSDSYSSEVEEVSNDSGSLPTTTPCKNAIHHKGESSDSLSFITLSGEFPTPSSQSCHLIPNKCALKRILQWLMPSCVKRVASSSTDPSTSQLSSKTDQHASTREINGEQARHEIETLVEASDKLTFPASQTNISFEIEMMKPGRVLVDENKNNDSHSHKTTAESSIPSQGPHLFSHQDHHSKGKSHSHHHHHHQSHHKSGDNHKHHSHHHGLFHWKHILPHHGPSKKMTVMGGDVLESEHGSIISALQPLQVEHECDKLVPGDKPDLLRPLDDDSFTEDSEDGAEVDVVGASAPAEKQKRLKQTKRVKPCKAFNRLLTLRDLGYQTGNSDEEELCGNDQPENCQKPNQRKVIRKKHVVAAHIGDTTSTSNLSALSTDCSDRIDKSGIDHPNPQDGKGSNENRSKYTMGNKRKYRAHSRPPCKYEFKETKVGNRDDHSSADDGDDDISSCNSGYPLSVSPKGSSQQNSIATTHYDDSLSNSGQYYGGRSSIRGNNIETRFLDPKDLLLPKYKDKLPFTFDQEVASIAATDSNSFDYDPEESVLEWVDKDFEDIEESLGLLNSCLEVILTNGQLLDVDVDAKNDGDSDNDTNQSIQQSNDRIDEYDPDKVDGQHRIVTLNDLEKEADMENMNEDLTTYGLNV